MDQPMIQLVEKNDVSPVCPHCRTALHEVWYRGLSAWLGKRYIYFCPGCQKVLGVSHRKGFWMG
jgi:hypothetical protein